MTTEQDTPTPGLEGGYWTKRLTVPTAEAILGREYRCLDKGFVRLVDYSGGDARVVQSARVSYGAGTKTVREDQGLINYLIENAHTSPLEQVNLTFHIKLPLFVFAQMVRTRTARLNSMSARYSVMESEFYLPSNVEVRAQSQRNKQVGEGEISPYDAMAYVARLGDACEDAYKAYEDALNAGVAREMARMVLPQNLYTQVYWQIDLSNLFKTLKLRLDWHAQYEYRVYAGAMEAIVREVAPMCHEAFKEYMLEGCSLSRTEIDAVRRLIKDKASGLSDKAHAKLLTKLNMEVLS